MTDEKDRVALLQVAEHLGPSAVVTSGENGSFALDADVGGAAVSDRVEPSGRRRRIFRAEADAPGAGDLEVELYPEGFGSSLGKVFGAQDLEVGESRFDDRYMIKASDEGLAVLWLDYETRKLVARSHKDHQRIRRALQVIDALGEGVKATGPGSPYR